MSELILKKKQEYNSANKKLPNGTAKQIYDDVLSQLGVCPSDVSMYTIMSRVKRNNPTGYAPQSTSPLAGMEPELVEYCIRLAKMGSPCDKEQVH